MNDEQRRLTGRQIAILAGLLLVAGMTTWLLRLNEPVPEKERGELRHDPDYFVDQFTATAMDISGHPRYRLRAVKAVHFMDDETTELTQPYMTLFEAGKPSWFVRSERGRVSPDGKTIWLLGEVHVRRPPDAPPPVEMDTRDLMVRPDDEFAETDQAVTVRSPQGVVNAVGMRAHLKQRRLQLLSQVRGRYETSSP